MAEQEPVGQEVIDRVMEKIENFYFSDDADGGENMFNEFAARHAHLFEDGCDAEEMENKLE